MKMRKTGKPSPMADIVSRDVRSRMMSSIRSQNTGPEMIVRKGLFAAGFRYRLHVRNLPGKPDLVFPKHRAVIFVHGCFWHGHDGCHLFRLPAIRQDFWQEKIEKNISRDRKNAFALSESSWRLATVWECALRGKTRLGRQAVIELLSGWLHSDNSQLIIKGKNRQ